MKLEWWFDHNGDICKIDMRSVFKGRWKLSFSEGFRGELLEEKQLRAGITRKYGITRKEGVSVVFATRLGEEVLALAEGKKAIPEDTKEVILESEKIDEMLKLKKQMENRRALIDLPKKIITINDIEVRGERFISLYADGLLIKEYNYRECQYLAKYLYAPYKYESVKKFILYGLWENLIMAGFAAALMVWIMGGVMNFLNSPVKVVAFCFGAIVFLTSAIIFGRLLYIEKEKRIMQKYSIIGSSYKKRYSRSAKYK